MSELLKRADLFPRSGEFVRDGGEWVRVGDTAADLVGELADRIRYLESPTLSKRVAVGFFQYWWNTSGTNTNQGFDEYWKKLLMGELKLPSEGAVEDITEQDIHETKFPPAHAPHKASVDDIDYDPDYERKVNQRDPNRKTVTLEELQKSWLSGTTCHRQRRTVHWVSDDGQWIVMKHHGHSEWTGGWTGNSYCGTHYALFRVGDKFPDRMGQSPYFTQESRWSKASMEWVEKVMAGWRPDNFVETQ